MYKDAKQFNSSLMSGLDMDAEKMVKGVPHIYGRFGSEPEDMIRSALILALSRRAPLLILHLNCKTTLEIHANDYLRQTVVEFHMAALLVASEIVRWMEGED